VIMSALALEIYVFVDRVSASPGPPMVMAAFVLLSCLFARSY